MSSRRFVTTVLGISGTAFLAVAVLNLCVNPYAQYPTQFVEPLVQTSRAQKTQLLSQLSSAPDGLIVGSSRVLKYEPDYLNLLLDQTFFNAGVNFGKPEDHLAFVRFFGNQFGQLPKTLIVGLDVHGFNDALPTDARLLNNQQLASRIPDAIPFADRFQSVKELLSWQQTMSSIRSLKRSSGADCDELPVESYQSDGVIVYHEREKQIADGAYDFSSALDYNKREYKQLFAGYEKLSQKRLELFLETVKTCQEAGSKVIVFLTPMHPELDEYLAGSTTYHDRRSELIQFVAEQSRSRGFAFHDFTEIDRFGGSADLFVDGVHPLETNTRRAINRCSQSQQGSRNMLFNSYFFLFVFLPLVLYAWWSARLSLRARLISLVVASYFFYGWWDYRFVSLLLFSSIVDYHAGRRLHASPTERGKQFWLVVSMCTNLGLLAFFKYSGFMAESLNAVGDWLRMGGALPVPQLILPVGISFYTFQTMSYTIDIYRGQSKPANSFWHFSAYVSLFPQLIAGPIVRYNEMDQQLRDISPRINWDLFAKGVFFFVAGLAQKILLADTIAERVNPLFADYQSLELVGSWFAMLGYTCQLYLTFRDTATWPWDWV